MRDDAADVIRPQDVSVPREALELIGRNFAERYRICPVSISDGRAGIRTLTVATCNPADLPLIDQVHQMTGCRVRTVMASEQDIMRGIELHYSASGSGVQKPFDMIEQAVGGSEAVSLGQREDGGGFREARSGAVEAILQRAIADRASDVHIEPHHKVVYVRFRIDGVMYDHMNYEPAQHAQVVSRIKVLSKLDIAEKRLPQDGRFDMAMGQKEFDVRVSTVPSSAGEKVVLRLLPKGPMALDFNLLGLDGRNRQTLEELVRKPYGMVLATGPTGSGKTTTLYACMAQIDCVQKNVLTIEDPVEYQLPRITQIQIHPKIGLTFASGLRSILRQDPDIIMVGEIRDLETLEMAIHSALTGHLVLSTLHCNDTAAAAARMVDMGAEPFLVASSVTGLVAQRLVRRICDGCKTPVVVTPIVRDKLNLPDDGSTYYHGTGCNKCRGTGFSGRVSVFEVVTLNEAIQEAIIRKAPASEIRRIMHENGAYSLLDDGLAKARTGVTSLEEVMRAVYVEKS